MAKMYKTILILCLSLYVVFAKHEQYDGHALYEISVKDLEQSKLVNSLESQLGIDVWAHALPARKGLVLVSKEQKTKFEALLRANGIEYKVDVENIKEKLELEDQLLAAAMTRSNKSTFGLSFDTIHRYDVVDAYLVELAEKYPETVTLVSGGRSFEGRDIKYLKISTTNFEDHSKPIVMMESLLHCREWITLPATLYAIQKLVIDVTEQDLVESIDWIILPIANPDGYEFTHTNTRFWRKNRRTGPINLCTGVDLNRNFDMNWGTASSSSSCSDTFHGSAPFSEPEAAIVGKIIDEYKYRMELYMDIHSYGSWMLYGFGNGTLPPNGLVIHMVGVMMANSIDAAKLPTNPNYIVGNVRALLYAASGSSQDYAQAVGVPLSYTYELPAYQNRGGLDGFLVDPDFIEQAGMETWEGIKTGARFVAENRKIKNLV